MKTHVEQAPAKINLTLDVLGLRPDGYHDLDMIMQSVSLFDTVTIALEKAPGVRLIGGNHGLPNDRKNLAIDAAARFLEAIGKPEQGLAIGIEKRIPVCAGTAGGSSDAAATLRGLNSLMGAGLTREQLMEIGAQVGSDVPYCVMGGTARARGRGEIVTPLTPLASCHIVLCKPDFAVSTPVLFLRIDDHPPTKRPGTASMLAAVERGDATAIAHGLFNVFEEVLPEHQGNEVRVIKETLHAAGALGAAMSGTGPTVFGLFEDEKRAQEAARHLNEGYAQVFLARPV